jgi:hypothetical protein
VTVTITDSTIAANTFNGGTIGVTSSTLSALGKSPTTSVNGAFFGPTSEEVGGVIALADTATGNPATYADQPVDITRPALLIGSLDDCLGAIQSRIIREETDERR